MAEAMFVAPLVSVLILKLTPVALSCIPSGGIDRKLKKWTNMLNTIQAVLEDAEVRQINEKPIQLWLHDVQKLAFEIEDMVTEVQQRQMIETPESSCSSRMCVFTSRFSPAIKFNYDMDQKIGEISKSLKELEKRKNILRLKACTGGDLRPPTSSLGARVFGREEENDKILTWLLKVRASDQDGQLRVISIVGMGGIGKTALAQSLYNNEGVKVSFPNRAWVCVTRDFDVLKLSKIIFEVYGKSCTFNELNKVQEKLQKKLSKNKFLLVLDDVWNEDYAKWVLLSAPLRIAPLGSTIIVTSRSQVVAKIMGSKEVYDLKELSEKDCLSLLAQHAFDKPNFDGHPEFKEVGTVIAERCKGLPLAAKSLGGLLRTKRSPSQWKEISTSMIWELQSNDIIPALRLSYHHLPPYLKPLFVYCSLFPKGYEFDKQELIMLWMAQGYLGQTREEKQMEELGCEYFGELLSRSFFQFSPGNNSRFMMHDYNNDLAHFVAGLTYLRLDDKIVSNEQYKIPEEARHASFILHEYDDFQKFKASNAAQRLRTLLAIREKSYRRFYLSSLILKDFPRLPCLRALSFNGYQIRKLPKSIGNLNHLRYLDVSWTNIQELPKSVCALSNLQTLLLHGCEKLVQLPKRIHKLINLRHLDITDTPSLEGMPSGISLLTHLRRLSKFMVDKSLKIAELKGLHHLQGELSIIGIEKVMNVQEAKEANLWCKEGLYGLEMRWNRSFGCTREEELELEVLDALKPQTGLKGLEIEFYGGHKFPSWVGDHSFSDMVKLSLIGCKNCTNLPPLGQLTSLKNLSIVGMNGVKIVGMEFIGSDSAFRSLIKLCFRDMNGWEEWCVDENLKGAFPCLQELEISGCMKLNNVLLPKLPSLRALGISGCGETILTIMVGLGSVKELEIGDISELNKLDERIIQCLGEVENLSVFHCKQLTCLWKEKFACQELKKMKRLTVSFCKKLELLGDEKEQLLPHTLESLVLRGCDKLEKIPNWQNNLSSLRQLTLRDCKKLQDNLALTKVLEPEIENQGRSSSEGKHEKYEFSNLESVRIWNCPTLKWFPTGKKLPIALKNLSVWGVDMEEVENGMSLRFLELVSFGSWSKLKSLPQGLTQLTWLVISGCSGIESIPETILPPTLIILQILGCSNLKYMLCANEMQSLKALRQLEIKDCKNLEGYPSRGCWPPNLESLLMGDIKDPITEWGLANLRSSLLNLTLVGEFPEVVSFSVVETQLPGSLTRLVIMSLKNLESLGEGLENLSSLRQLTVSDCPKLCKLPETSLPRLSSLRIDGCPLLKEKCKKRALKRDYWHKISHIPNLRIDNELMWGL